jgi:two-component system, response regulator PdtaR
LVSAGKLRHTMPVSVTALRILVAEDDPLIGILLDEMLVEMGHEVCAVVASEAEAVAAAGQHKPDLVIVDARLGDGSGVHAVDAMLRLGPMPHVFVTGDATSVRRSRPEAVVIEKPFREPDLVDAIQRAIDAVDVR